MTKRELIQAVVAKKLSKSCGKVCHNGGFKN